MTTYLHREDRLGVFVPFMPALRRADDETLQLCYAAQENYTAGYITAETFTARVAALLGLPS